MTTLTSEGEITTLKEYDDGTKVIGITTDPDDPAWRMGPDRYRVISASGRSFEPKDRMFLHRRRRALLLGELFHRFGYMEFRHDEDMVPVEVIAAGKPAVVSYLWGVNGVFTVDAADKLGIAPMTAYQYTDHFLHGGR